MKNHEINRQQLRHALEGALVVLSGYDALQLSNDMEAPFLQEGSFWWVTGIEEPGWRAIIDTARNDTTLVRPKQSGAHQVFNGVLSDEEALRISGAKRVIALEEFEPALRRLARTHSVVCTINDTKHEYEFIKNPAPAANWSMLERIFASVRDVSSDIAKLRAIKQPHEIAAIEKAIKLTNQAFIYVRERLPQLKNEYEIEAEFTYFFRKHDANHAYAPIVAAGPRACTLHYGKNNQKVSVRDMVLIDIGARVEGYAADITRTFALKPTKRQKEVHAAVERAHKEIISLLQPDLPVLDYMQQVDTIMKRELMSLGLLSREDDTETYRRYFPHAIGHGLGVDVHDALGGARYLRPGMIMTVEPGIYIPEEGIGVRIEDDILITETGHRNMSGSLSTSL